MNFSIIIAVIAILFIFIVLWFVTKFLTKVFMIIFILALGIGYLYVNQIGPFNHEKLTVNSLNKAFCNDSVDVDICDCIVKNIQVHADSLNQLDPDDKYFVQKSLITNYGKSMECLKLRNAEKKYKKFLVELSGYDLTVPDSLQYKAQKVGEKIIDKFK